MSEPQQRLRAALLSIVAVGLVAVASLMPLLVRPLQADINQLQRADIVSSVPGTVKFTVQQRHQQQLAQHLALHPYWKTLSFSQRAARATVLAQRAFQVQTATGIQPTASFLGNLTGITAPGGQALALQRQSDCSLTLFTGTYTVSASPTVAVQSTTANFERVLHSEAQLSTTADAFAGGCAETLPIHSRQSVYLGKTAANLYLGVAAFYDGHSDALDISTFDPAAQQVHAFSASEADPNITLVAGGDLNGDGLSDAVGVDALPAGISVWLALPNGTLGAPTLYPLNDSIAEAAVIADVNGDGKADVVVATHNNAVPSQETIWVFTGNGNGTLNPPQSLSVPTPMGFYGAATINNLIAADLRHSGHLDIVASNGLVLLNNGSGSFSVGQYAFAPPTPSSDLAPDLVAADFNHDGKLDLAVDDGLAVHIYPGNGDGTFTVGRSYEVINDVGYLTATDLDGDGNIDLYIGLANGGFYSSDQSGANEAYALMGNGDGTFRGAPVLPFVYTGTNLADLNGDHKIDAVGVNSDFSFTSYLGDGSGNFTAKSTLATNPLTLYGVQHPNPGSIDSFGLADVNGDGHADLMFILTGFNVAPPNNFVTTGFLLATGDGAGNFAAPTFIPISQLLPSPDIDVNPVISNVRLADVNHDGKADLIYNYQESSYLDMNYYHGVAVQLGNGDGTFQNAKTLVLFKGLTNSFVSSAVVTITDVNKDGNPDLLIEQQSSVQDPVSFDYPYILEVALGRGDGTFSAPTAIATNDVLPGAVIYGTQASPIVVADMNGDGNPDIVSLGSTSTGNMQVAIALGNGDGTFKAPNKTSYAEQYLGQSIAVGDFNGDGKLDVATAGFLGPYDSGVTLGNGDGTLAPFTGAAGLEPSQALYVVSSGGAIGMDFNGDGKTDLLVGDTLLLATGATPTASFTLSASSTAGSVAAGQSAQSTVTVTPTGGFTGNVSLTCSALPAGASCQFSAPSVTLGAAQNSILTLSTTARTAQLLPQREPLSPWFAGGWALAGMLLPLGMISLGRSDAQQRRWLLLLVAIIGLSGCGGGSSSSPGSSSGSSSSGSSSSGSGSSSSGSSSSSSGGGGAGTPAGSYSVLITATSGSTSTTLTYSLTVT